MFLILFVLFILILVDSFFNVWRLLMNSACARTLVRTIWVAWYVCTHTIIYCWYSPYSDMSSNLLFDLSGCQTSMSVQHTHYSLSPSVPPSLPSILAFPLTHPPLLPPSLTHSPPLTPPPPSLPLILSHCTGLFCWIDLRGAGEEYAGRQTPLNRAHW